MRVSPEDEFRIRVTGNFSLSASPDESVVRNAGFAVTSAGRVSFRAGYRHSRRRTGGAAHAFIVPRGFSGLIALEGDRMRIRCNIGEKSDAAGR
jgi:hypothetical protein